MACRQCTRPSPARVVISRIEKAWLREASLSRATADSAWLSKQLENGSSRPRAIEVADRGKHAYPDSGFQAYPRN